MDNNEFKRFIIETASKYLKEEVSESILKQPEPPKLTKPSFTKSGVNKLPKEPKAPKEPKSPNVVSIAKPKAVIESEEEVSCTPEKVKTLAEEMKKINKKIDLRNPLINPEFFDKIKNEQSENKCECLLSESQKDRWKNLYNYSIPEDDKR